MNKENLSIADMLQLSKTLHQKYQGKWEPLEPEHARDSILYMVEEIGEVISVIKKKSVEQMMTAGPVRNHLVEELADVLMYFNDTLLRLKITPEEFSKAYVEKYQKNLKRDFVQEHQDYIESKE